MMMPSVVPFGFVFDPSDEQLVKHYLLKAITGEPTGPFTIPKADVYGCDPCTLDWSDKHLKNMLRPNELYFYVDREKISDNPAVKRPRRTLKAKTHGGDCGCGYWNSNATGREILDERTGTIIGTKRTLTFFQGQRRKGQKTDYIMHEYLLCSGGRGVNHHHHQHDDFQKLALCRIKFKGKKNTTSTLPPFGPSSSPLQLDKQEYEFASRLEDYLQQPEDSNVHYHEEQTTFDHTALLASLDADAGNVGDEPDLMNYVHELEASLEQAPLY